MMRRLLWFVGALAGVVLAAGVTYAASSLSTQRIGLSSEPASAGQDLAPARTETPTPTPTPTPRQEEAQEAEADAHADAARDGGAHRGPRPSTTTAAMTTAATTPPAGGGAEAAEATTTEWTTDPGSATISVSTTKILRAE